MEIPQLNKLHRTQLTRKCFSKRYPEYYHYILNKYPDVDWKEGWYLELNHLSEPPRCPMCGSPLTLISIYKGYSKNCSRECSYKNPERIQKIESTTHNKFGVKHPLQSEELKLKAKITSTKRYGDPNYNNRDKCKNTCIEKYGGMGNASAELKNKMIHTWRINRLKSNIIKDQIGYTKDGWWIMRCDKGCPGCNGTYEIESGNYFDRKRLGIELCTILNPISHNKTANTSIEKFIKDILDEYDIKYISNDRTIISPREVDIYIPSKHIAIECNGIWWHSMKDDSYHRNKWEECKNTGVQLLTVWQDWIYLKPDIVRSMILSKVGMIDLHIGARECIIREVSPKEAGEFLDNNHIQGKCRSNVKIGLYHEDKLVSLGCFSKNNNEWTLVRFCNIINTRVVGAAGKIMSYFIKRYHPLTIISFSSNDISDGGLYRALGFEEVGKSDAYWYIKRGTFRRYHRSLFSKSELKKKGIYQEGLTEREIMRELPYYRIQDSGITKWKLYIHNQ